jgi:dTDP-4-amino-4,6-dideoxygalactose transaminase
VTPLPLLTLDHQNRPLGDEFRAAFAHLLDSQHFILGPEVRAFEQAAAAYLQVPHAVACASGSDALLLALLAAGVGPGDAVLTTPFTFFATAGYIVRAGARPVFCDIEPGTFNLNPALIEDAARRSPLPVKAIIPVHLFGAAADMDPIAAIARRHGWSIVEDAAQSIGAEYRGRRVCSIGDTGCLSFYPSKNLGAFGDGGLVTTTDPALAARLAALHMHGESSKYIHQYVGINSRLDTIQAAVLSIKLRHLDEWTATRQRNAELYGTLLAGLDLGLPAAAPYQTRHVWNQYTVRSPRRDQLKDHLAAQGIGSGIYYPLPLHLQPCFEYLGYQAGDFPESERASREVLSLPIHDGLTPADIERVARAIAEFARPCG